MSISPRLNPFRSRAAALLGVIAVGAGAGMTLAQPAGTTPVSPLSGNQPDAVPQLAQPAVTPAMADAAWQAQRWAEAANFYRVLCREDPDNGEYHFRLAYALHADGQYRRAVPAHEEAAGFDEYRSVALYNLGCAHAVLGNADRAFEALNDALDAGFDDREQMQADHDLFPLHDDARWASLMVDRRPPVVPPAPITRPSRGPLDEVEFLLGEWEVLDERGRRVASTSIHPAHDDRALIREWRGDDGSTGTAVLFWDEFLESWRQVGIDSDGNVIESTGHAYRAELELDGEIHTDRGQRIMQRSTIEQRRDGNLDHVSEESEDEGRTWRVVREATYRHLSIVPPGSPGRPEPGRPIRPPLGGKPPK